MAHRSGGDTLDSARVLRALVHRCMNKVSCNGGLLVYHLVERRSATVELSRALMLGDVSWSETLSLSVPEPLCSMADGR